MGHQITAYQTAEQKEEVAYMGRSAFNPLNGEMYYALGCMEFYDWASGIGAEKAFTKAELLAALDYVKSNEKLDYEREFIDNCLAAIEENGRIIIRFS